MKLFIAYSLYNDNTFLMYSSRDMKKKKNSLKRPGCAHLTNTASLLSVFFSGYNAVMHFAE